jgi:phytoene synthase
VEQDLTKKRYETFRELEFYLYRVASAVGLLCIDIFGHTDKKTADFAKYTGYAVHLTNIIRDISTDAKLGRIYIPLEDLKQFDVSEKDLLNCKMNVALKNLLKFQAERAKKYYALAKKKLPQSDRERAKKYYALAKKKLPQSDRGNMLPARIMSLLYEKLLRKIEHTGFAVCGKRIKLNTLDKLTVLAKAFLSE